MIRALLTLMLCAVLAIQPSLGQVSGSSKDWAAMTDKERDEAFLERDKLRVKEALARAASDPDMALRARAKAWAAKTETLIGDRYQHPDPNHGMTPDMVQARSWYARATQHGDTDGAYKLGEMYWSGTGGSKDQERAKALWVWAAENGERVAVARMESLGYNMQKERELAFGKAIAPRTHQDDADDAAKGLMVILGALLVAKLAHDVNETPECREHRLAILAGTAPWSIMAGCN